MSGDDDNHSFNYQLMHPVSLRNRKRRSAQPQRPKNREFETIKAGLRIEARKQRQPEAIGKGRPDPDVRPRKSMLRATKELLCTCPEISVQQLMEKLERQGYEAAPVTITSIRRDFLDTIKVAREMGYIKVLD